MIFSRGNEVTPIVEEVCLHSAGFNDVEEIPVPKKGTVYIVAKVLQCEGCGETLLQLVGMNESDDNDGYQADEFRHVTREEIATDISIFTDMLDKVKPPAKVKERRPAKVD